MSINTNLKGRLRNTDLPKSKALFPLYEAVVNSIHSIDEAKINCSDGFVKVTILRENQLQLAKMINDETKPRHIELPSVTGFKITDNGIGFNEKNMESFETLDSEYKADIGCRGVGRLVWLKAFEKISINSTFVENDEYKKRSFTFDKINGVNSNNVNISKEKNRETIVCLENYYGDYREVIPKTAQAIAEGLFEHCLWYFVRDGGAPKISVYDGGTKINLDHIFQTNIVTNAINDIVTVKRQEFNLIHIRLRNNLSKSHSFAYCANNRLVTEENINNKINGLFGKLNDDNGEFIYTCYISSKYLDNRVQSERTRFNIPESNKDDKMFSDSTIFFEDIRNSVLERAKELLKNSLLEKVQENRDRVEKFVSTKAPRYRPILSRITDAELCIDQKASDKDLDIFLNKQLFELQNQIISEGHDLMQPSPAENIEDYENRVKEYLDKVSDLQKTDLASYVSHRKVVIDLLQKAIERKEDGTYVREDFIHKLLIPMGKDSHELFQDSHNLWLIEERLAFHSYLASDKTLNSMPITGAMENLEPDIVSLNLYDNPLLLAPGKTPPLASLNIIELKRPMRNDMKGGDDRNPIDQTLNYLEKIRSGGVTSINGRSIPRSEDIPGFCYIICDLTTSMIERAKSANLQVTSDKMGYFGYNSNYKAYIEVISFDRLLNAAKERNRVFFDKLGLPTT